jgi:pimeloyl-ACP methyl ester carboxylesterase
MILAGHSMGATASVMAALLRPDLVRALVLIEPVFVPARGSWVHLKRFLRFGRAEPNLADRAERRRNIFDSLEAVEKTYRGRGAFKSWPDEIVHDYLKGGLIPIDDGAQMRLACAPVWEAETFRSTPFGITSHVRDLRCPVTIIYGGHSNTCSDAEARRFARHHRGTRRVKIAKAGHFLPMEYPDAVRAEIVRLRDSLS